MRVVVDTNVLVSGVFFGGVPGRILEAWRDGTLTLVVSSAILEEYHRVGALLGARYPGVDLEPVLALVAVHAEVVQPATLADRVCEDPDDDKFMTCALAGGRTVGASRSDLRGVPVERSAICRSAAYGWGRATGNAVWLGAGTAHRRSYAFSTMQRCSLEGEGPLLDRLARLPDVTEVSFADLNGGR
jgi:putative PIN family toxin of toxin-antitoxin system